MSIELVSRQTSLTGVLGLLLACSFPGSGLAQEDVQNRSVLDRSRPEYDSRGLPLGPFEFRPSVLVAGSYDDNVLATDGGDEDDLILTIAPEARLLLRRPTYEARISAGAELERYSANSTENSENYNAEARGRVGLGTPTVFTGRVAYRSIGENRRSLDSATNLTTRLRRESLLGEARVDQDFGDLDAFVSGRVRDITYGSARNGLGELIDFSFRDRTIYTLTGGADYAITANDSFLARVTYDKRDQKTGPDDADFDRALFDRSSEGWRIEGGYGRQVSELLSLRMTVGYLKQSFDDDQLKDISGLSFTGDLFWNATPLTSVNARLSRSIDETVSPLLAGNLRSEGVIRVDHEARRNLILSAYSRYAYIDPQGQGENSQEFEIAALSRLFINSFMSLNAELRHFQRDSDNPSIRFNENVALIGLRFSL